MVGFLQIDLTKEWYGCFPVVLPISCIIPPQTPALVGIVHRYKSPPVQINSAQVKRTIKFPQTEVNTEFNLINVHSRAG